MRSAATEVRRSIRVDRQRDIVEHLLVAERLADPVDHDRSIDLWGSARSEPQDVKTPPSVTQTRRSPHRPAGRSRAGRWIPESINYACADAPVIVDRRARNDLAHRADAGRAVLARLTFLIRVAWSLSTYATSSTSGPEPKQRCGPSGRSLRSTMKCPHPGQIQGV